MNSDRLTPLPTGSWRSSSRSWCSNCRSRTAPTLPLLGAYALSFVNIGIFWNNHHHSLALVEKIDARVLWANLSLLFWLSLVPLVIRWIGEAHLSAEPVAAYGVILTMASLAYVLLERAIIRVKRQNSELAETLGGGRKEVVSVLLFVAGVPLAFMWVWAAITCYVAVAALWFIPDQRVEEKVAQQDPTS